MYSWCKYYSDLRFSCLKKFSTALPVILGWLSINWVGLEIILALPKLEKSGGFSCENNRWQSSGNNVAIMWQYCENVCDILKRGSDNFWKTRIIATTISILDFFSLLTIWSWMQNTNQKLCISGTDIKVVVVKIIEVTL